MAVPSHRLVEVQNDFPGDFSPLSSPCLCCLGASESGHTGQHCSTSTALCCMGAVLSPETDAASGVELKSGAWGAAPAKCLPSGQVMISGSQYQGPTLGARSQVLL